MSSGHLAIGYTFTDHDAGVIDAARVAAYAAVSGDDNPIHLDTAAARAVGLDGTIIQGMLLMALADEALAGWLPASTCRRLSARFTRPADTGSAIVISGRVVRVEHEGDARVATLRIFIRDEAGAIVTVAEAVVAY